MADLQVLLVVAGVSACSFVWSWVYDRRYRREAACVREKIAIERESAKATARAAQTFASFASKIGAKPDVLPGDEWKGE